MIDFGGDISLYSNIIRAIFTGRIPFINFYFEYPPLVFLSFLLPGVLYFLGNFDWTLFAAALVVQNLILIFCISILVNSYLHKSALGVDTLTLLLLIILSPLALLRVDLFICFIVVAGFFILEKQKNTFLGFLLIILAGFMKIYALVFLPLLAIHYWRKNDRRNLFKLLGIFGTFLAVHLLVFLINPIGFEFLFNFHGNRGFQLESLYAGILMLLPIQHLETVFNFGSTNITYPGIERLLILPPILILLGTGWLYWKFLRSKLNTWEETFRFCVLTLMWFVIFNKVFSTQFLIWFLPLVRLIRFGFRKQVLITLLLVLVSITGVLIYPFGYVRLLDGPVTVLGGLVSVKNLLIVILFGAIYKTRGAGETDKQSEQRQPR